MARPGVTYLEVAKVASQLLGQGKNPTIEQVRRQLGTGSSTTLAYHLRQWKKDHSQNQKLACKENLPEELISIMQGLWKRVMDESTERVAQGEAAHQTRIDALLPELQKYKSNNQRWQQLYTQWMQEKNLLSQDKAAAEKLVQQLQRHSAAWVEKEASFLKQVEEKQDRIRELQRLQQQTQANWDHFRESTRTQRLLEQQRHEKEKQELQAQIKELHSKQNQMKKALSQREKQYQAASQKVQNFKTLYQETKQKNEAQGRKWIDFKTEIRVLTAQLTQAHQQIEEAQTENKRLGQEKWTITKEKAQLEGQLKQLQSFVQLREA